MPDFKRPRTQKGYKLRKEALQSANPRVQRLIQENLAEEEEGERQSVQNIAWQLQHGDDSLSHFAAGEVDKAIDWYDGRSHDPSGGYGRLLALLSRYLHVTIGDLIGARGDKDRIIALSRQAKKNGWE